MPVRTVASKQNARLKELRQALAQPGRAAGSMAGGAGSLVGIEGPNLIMEALRAGLRIATVFVAQGSERLLDPLPLPPDTDVLLVPRELLLSALVTETPQPIAALIEPPQWDWPDLLNQKSLVLVLCGIQDPGNLGTLLRSAEAFGATGVICLPGTVSPWNPKAVRASAGSVFRIPLLAASADEYLRRLNKSGVKILAATVRDAQPANLVDLTGPIALLIGNEGNGLPQDLASRADAAVTVPCPGPVESLNAAVAAAVLLYEAARQRSAAKSTPADSPLRTSKESNRGAVPHAVAKRSAR